jgi:Protein of unknown function (DUF2975)
MSHDPVPLPRKGIPLRAQCGKLGAILAVFSFGLAGLIGLETIGPLMVQPISARDAAVALVGLVSPLAYTLGLWSLSGVLRGFSREGRFVDSAFDALRSIGFVLAIGAVFKVIVEPELAWWLGRSRGYWIGLDPGDIALGLMGAGLWVFARLFRRAARLEAELDGFI